MLVHAELNSRITRCPDLPFPTYGGPNFPIAVYCRSPEEAQKIWALNKLVEDIEDDNIEDVKRTLLSSALASNVLSGERKIKFYSALYSSLRYACIFLSW